MDVESPYEVHDYVRSYLGEGKDAIEFGKQFLERRSKYKNHLKQEQPEVSWLLSDGSPWWEGRLPAPSPPMHAF